ncbi:MAG TPA: NADH-dependent [FeFe] hydrogenase, group A6 [Candidatus Omnitrophota bacterium]|nr:NADH-dependent [FeFe] hydrogenase, group A6 [Candidatus Omnitrophota bacterium]
MKNQNTVIIDGREIPIEGERNLLEVIRKAGINIPTFCYHSELSVYGACRLCMVDVEGRGLVSSCSTPPEAGMKIRTNTEEIRSMRKITIELLLANHDQNCPTCPKNTMCQLQNLAKNLGIKKVRFKNTAARAPIDDTSLSIVRDPNKCILCGDCVRMCSEVQGVGVIDFAYRGSESMVVPSFKKNLDSVECVYCGQCSRVCPTGALTPKPETDLVWKALDDKKKIVVAQIAPAVRVAIGEMFTLQPGVTTTGQIITALRSMGFDKVFDTSFTADLTVIEEGNEFLQRVIKGEKLPLFTSCCPAWVKFAEQYYPGYLKNLSSCRSPQQMFGSLTKEMLSMELGVKKEDIVVVSIMPCTAKKYEAKRPEFKKSGVWDIDHVITTQELGTMIGEAGLCFTDLEPGSFDMPFGFKTGGGIIFGNSGGVSEAVLRFVTEKVPGAKTDSYEFTQARGQEGIRELTVTLNGRTVKMAIVNGLGNAKKIMERIKNKEAEYDFVEVMACPGGCIGGAGQPVYHDNRVRGKRTKGLYENDRMLQLHRPQENPYIVELYKKSLEAPGSQKAHNLLHTHYKARKRIFKEGVTISGTSGTTVPLEVSICFGTSCFLKGAQNLLHQILEYIKTVDIADKVEVKASFCFEKCDSGPMIRVGDVVIEHATFDKVRAAMETALAGAHGNK